MANPFRAVAVEMAERREIQAAFHGASSSRLFYDWAVRPIHPDVEIRSAIGELRARARDLVRNNPYATGIVDAFADNVIGQKPGIRLIPTVKIQGTADFWTEANEELSRAWGEWGYEENATVTGVDSWTEFQKLLIRTWVTDGEAFIRRRRGHDNAFAYAVELLDADLLDHKMNVPPDSQGREIKMGVEVDRNGRRLAYHFSTLHPSERGNRETVRIPAEDIIHFYQKMRPDQTRGYSLFAPILTTVKMIDGLTEAELVASRLAAAKMGFIVNMTPEAINAYADRLRLMTDQQEDGTGSTPQTMDLAPGVLEELLPGQSFEGFDPHHPNAAFEVFLKVMLRGVARAFSISYLTLTGDVGAANYSSMRAGLLPERDHWKGLHDFTADKVHRVVYRDVITHGLLTGAVRLPNNRASEFLSHEWQGRGWDWVDPLKDLQAKENEVKLGVNSRQRVAAEKGRDYRRIVDEIAEEETYAEEKGVDVSGAKGSSAGSGSGGGGFGDQDDEDENENRENGNGTREGGYVRFGPLYDRDW